jgi:O-antigen/teichoic acid export membrane protein
MPSAAPRGGRLASDAAILAVAALLTQGAGIISTIALARLLPLRDFGLYQELLLLYGLLAPLLFGGVPAALSYYVARARTEEDRAGWTFDGVMALTALGVLFAALLVLLRGPLSELLHERGRLTTAIALIGPYVVFAFAGAAVPNALVATGRARASALISAFAALVHVALLIGAAAVFEDVRALALAMGVSALVGAAVGLVVAARLIGFRPRLRGLPARSLQLGAYGLPLALTGLAGMLGFQFDRVVISQRFSPEVFAIYAVGAVELPLAAIVQQSVNSVLLPELARLHRDGDLSGMAALWRRTIAKVALILLPVFVLAMVVADDLLRVAFGGRFAESVDVFRIYLLLMPLRVATFGLLPMAIGRTGINLSAALIVLGSNVVLALALVGPLGIEGPALATVIATTLAAAYYLVRLRGLLGLPVRDLFPWRRLTEILAIAALVAVPLWPLAQADLPRAVRLVLVSALYAPLALAALRLTRRIEDGDWERLMAQLRRLRPRARGGPPPPAR